MKKIGILTLFGELNFGNRLQNYAVQQILNKKGFEAETIKYLNATQKPRETTTAIEENRIKKFREFNKLIKFSKEILYEEYEAPKYFSNYYDYIAIGSDQIWNFTFKDISMNKAMAAFMPRNKKFSISASFGVDFVPERNSSIYNELKENLENIEHISVRERSASNIINKITGREDIEVLIDPTMMILREEWENVMKKPESIKPKRYILKNILGKDSTVISDKINKFAKKHECEIIDISNKDSLYYDIGPSEFLYLVNNAFTVVTDSFHSCVFAMLFSTPFVVFERQDDELKNMHSRLDTLLNTFEMKNRIIKDEINDDILNMNSIRTEEILQEERKKMNNFLDRALK